MQVLSFAGGEADMSGDLSALPPGSPSRFLFLQNNKFSGTLRETLFSPSLHSLIVWGNLLSGTLSNHLFDSKSQYDSNATSRTPNITTEYPMQFLSLQGNKLAGTLPGWLCQTPNITASDYSGNVISGWSMSDCTITCCISTVQMLDSALVLFDF